MSLLTDYLHHRAAKRAVMRRLLVFDALEHRAFMSYIPLPDLLGPLPTPPLPEIPGLPPVPDPLPPVEPFG
ncbi:MAG: hypothetical protein AB7G11_11175 [Phycisphaerales bacterium]